MCEICNASTGQKRNAMGIMLKGSARAYFLNHVRHARTLEEAVNLLRKQYKNHENKCRLLAEWKGMKLTIAMRNDPETSEIGGFQAFVARSMEKQGQLSGSYQGYRYLRDRLQEEIDIPAVKEFLLGRPAKDSQALMNRVANKLSNRPKTAGALIEKWVDEDCANDSKVAL